MNRLSFFLIVSVIIISFADNSKAQDTSIRDKRAYGFGVGLGFGSMSVGDNTNSNFSLSVNGRIGNHFLLIAEINPLPVKSPVMDESFNAFNIFLSPSFGRTFRLQPGLGLQFRTWSGSEKVENSDVGPIICIDAGYEFQKYDKYSLAIEFVYRNSLIELEGSVASEFIGLQIVALRKR
jgi:hypothetical protein